MFSQPQSQPAPIPQSQSVYYPESQVEFDSQLSRIDNRATFKNPKLARLLSDDLVRSYLDDYQIKALYHLAAAFEALTDASQGKYDGVFDNAAEAVLTDINFIINIARSREGVNIRTIKGRPPIEEFKKKNIMDGFKPVPGNQNQQGQQQNQMPDNYYPNYQQNAYR